MKSTTNNRFAQIPKAKNPRSSFDLSHGHKSTFDSGYLVPVFSTEALPGDTFKMRMNAFARMTTPVYPIMDNLFMDVFHFDVPLRLLWTNFPKFMGEQTDPGDSIDYTIPITTSGTHDAGTISDYLGIPTGVNFTNQPSSLYHRAIALIYNEWFRDQNLQDSVPFTMDDGPDTLGTDIPENLLRRGKRHDYFTSCLPWPQKSDSINMPLGTTAPVMGIGIDKNGQAPISSTFRETDQSSDTTATAWKNVSGTPSAGGEANFYIEQGNSGVPGLYADLSSATSATISAMRTSVALQQMLERDARGGTRYKEIIHSHFGVVSPDARLQRPEFLGGGSFPINISPIAQTSATDAAVSPQGNLAAMATASINGNGFVKSFTEHSIVISFVSVRADLTYQQGLNRQFSRQTRYDYFWPGLQNISEQEVLNKEIYADASANDELVFGYQERYAEYKYKPSILSGKMRSNASGTLDAWHLAQDFASLPTLGSTFIQETPPIDRVVAVTTEPEFLFDSFFDLKCVRPMAIYSTPGLQRF